MPSFLYTARDATGALSAGTMAADSVAAVTQKLRAEGKYPTSVKPADAATAAPVVAGPGVRVPRREVIQVTTQLTVMIETGVTLSEALDSIAAQAHKPGVRRLVEDLSKQVQAGAPLSAAMGRHPRSFPHLFVALVQAAERSGMLAKLMARGTAYLRDEQDIRRRVKGALTYPVIMFGFALVTTVFLLVYVLPRFTAIYAQKQAALPVPTKVLMNTSAFLVEHRFAVPVAAAALVGGLIAYRRTRSGARVWDYAQLRLPLLGPMFRTLHLARSLRMVGTMAGAGVNLVDCVQTAEFLSTNGYYKELWATVSDQIQVGRQLSEPLFHTPLVPRSYAQMLHSAEKGGKLAQVMEQVATHAEQELKDKLTELTRYIEPVMIAAMGLLIGGVALALLLPIFSISKVVAN